LSREDILGMNNEFVPLEEALALKELGFDQDCFVIYFNGTSQLKAQQRFLYETDVRAPLYQQAFRWLREEYGLDSYVKHLYKSTVKVGYFFCIDKTDGIEFHSMQGTLDSGYFDTYEEAELACLRKLIELANESI
jgi:hypothetical protein